MKLICQLSTSHRAIDTRIYDRIAKSLRNSKYKVIVIGQNEKNVILDEIEIKSILSNEGRLSKASLLKRAFVLAIKSKADIYHFHDPELVPIGVLLKLLGKKVIYDVHEDYYMQIMSKNSIPKPIRYIFAKSFTLFERLSSNLFNAVIATDRHVASKFSKTKVEIVANYPTLNFGNSSISSERKPSYNKFRVLYVGGLTYMRGIGKLIEALDYLDNDYEVHLAGEASDPSLNRMIESHSGVIHHGRVNWGNLPSFMSTFDLGVVLYQPVPAYTYYTGENIVKLFEYMACGLPVLISNFPKLEKLIKEIDCGIAADSSSPKDIAEKIVFLKDNPDLCKRFSKNGIEAFKKQFHWEIEEKKLLDVYAKALLK